MKSRVAWIAALFLLGCSEFKTTPSAFQNLDGLLFSPGPSDRVPATDKLTTKCLDSGPEFDACIFQKNPTAQEGKPVYENLIDENRRYGVKIRGLYTTGFLENWRVKVLTTRTPRFQLPNLSTLKAPISDTTSFLEQAQAYYWSNRVFEYLLERVGGDLLPAFGLSIYADDVFTGYVSKTDSIHLEKSPDKLSKAFSGEVIVALVGQALADELSTKRIYSQPTTQHKTCENNPRGCCKTENGCSQALVSAFGDYLSGIMFPESPRLGENLAQSFGPSDLWFQERPQGSTKYV